MTDQTFIWSAAACYAISGILTVDRLRRSKTSVTTHPINYATMLAGFVFHTLFLYSRGHTLQRCPLTNSFETTVFIAWAAVLFYLLIGPSYRVSFLGAFTAPFVLAILVIALLVLNDSVAGVRLLRSPWVDFHAGIAILSFGAFGLAGVTGLMYIIQERQLKTRKLTSSFLLLPSIEQLDVINARLTLLGFVMLTAGMIGGMISYRIIGHWDAPKIIWAVAVWLIYASITLARQLGSVRGRKIAWASVGAFAFALVFYWVISHGGGTP
ncbi:MAG: cytochrome c biogenesis protein CcsA [Verrucomicrobiota bacterium]